MAAKQASGSINQLAAAPHEKLVADLDPKFEWIDNATNYLLRLNLSGFKKEDFRVQVDSAGKLTVRGQRPAAAAAADGKHAPPPRSSFHKVFQLPSTANLDDISGRFEASVLTLTVPKRKQPTTIQEISKPKEEETSKQALDEATKKAAQHKEDALKKAMDDATTTKPQRKQDSSFNKAMDKATKKDDQRKEEDEARTRKQQQQPKQTQRPASMPMRREEMKPKAPEAAPAPANKPEVAGDKAKAVDRESLAAKVKRRAEEAERAKAAAAAEEAERETKTASGGWKERVAGELEELTDMKWADGLVEMARNNKEVVAAAIAALSLGFFVSQKLFSRK